MREVDAVLARVTLNDHAAAVRAARSIIRDHYPHSRLPEELMLVIEYLVQQRDALYSPAEGTGS